MKKNKKEQKNKPTEMDKFKNESNIHQHMSYLLKKLSCDNCNKIFERIKPNNGRNFCSLQCAREYRKKIILDGITVM